MKQHWKIFLLSLWLLPALCLPAAASASPELIPGGEAVGLELQMDGVYITEFSGPASPAEAAGLRIGDRIEQLNGVPVRQADDIPRLLEEAGPRVTLQIRRGAKQLQISLSPSVVEGRRMLGLKVQGSIAGIGTLTFYDPQSGRFGALGHAVSDPKGSRLPILEGQVLPIRLTQIRKGADGKAGSLSGTAAEGPPLGTILENLPQGVFGELFTRPEGEALPVGGKGEVRQGPAWIRCTVGEDGVREYEIEITAVRPRDPHHRSLQLQVTDPLLLCRTGGIVQGISGAPILQDGRLVGAVTHVLLDDPSRGYGILIEDMLEAARQAAA